jgi:hypothetical protein
VVHIDFKMLINQAGSEEGARVLFQRLIASLVRLKYKDAREIRPNPGDWGIDVLVGKLTGMSLIWQAKYFIDSVGDSQKKQIRDSFTQLMTKAKEHDFTVNAWTLCIPCNLSTDETTWWEGWKKRSSKKYRVKIELMDETALRAELESPDAEHIKMGYFGPNPTIISYFLQALKDHPERDIQELPELSLYEEALFIRKLKAGGIPELRSAKTQFFNAELLTQEIFDKGDTTEITSVQSIREKLRSMWETRFNDACANSEDLKGLCPTVMKAIEDQDGSALQSPDIKATFVHKQGIVHQMADKCEVGWSKDFREEFKEYYEQGTS